MSKYNPPSPQKRMWTGVFIIGAGILFLLHRMGVLFPSWFFDWPMILIAIGLLTGLQNNFRNNAWIILILLGALFIVNDNMMGWEMQKYVWPIAIILFGIFFLTRKKSCSRFNHRQMGPIASNDGPSGSGDANNLNQEFIDCNAFLGGIKKKVVSKNFQGGNISCVMAGAEIDLSQADIQQPVTIEISQLFAGVKLVVPSHWDVKSEVTAVLGGFDDKRNISSNLIDHNKILTIKGSTMFGGVEILSY
ncbi:MAG: hypothetical protein JSS67_10620 [Bacteroidetes bacterium]|nr:hypothetical protein [Bacteroidota bacterium]